MKKLPYLLVAVLIFLTACTVPSAADASTASDASAAPPQVIPLAGDEEETGPVYYGTFRLASCVFAPVCAMSMEEARQYLGATVTYAADSASNSLGDSCAAPSYYEQTVTAPDFSAGYNGALSLEDVNLRGEQVASVTLEDTGMFGSCFYVRDTDSLVIPLDGVFFLAQRVQS